MMESMRDARRSRLVTAAAVALLCAKGATVATPLRAAVGVPQTTVRQHLDLDTHDFPPLDYSVWWMQRRAWLIEVAERQLQEAPADPETAELLLDAARVEPDLVVDALAVVRRLIAGSLDDVEAAARILGTRSGDVQMARVDGVDREGELRALVDAIHARVPEQQRDQAARSLRSLLHLDAAYAEGARGETFTDKLLRHAAAFVEQYSGTDAALEAEILLIDLRSGPREEELRRQRLEAFARAHPGTVAGAAALHALGSSLSVDLSGPRGSDPTERLLRVVAIAQELQSGRWPASEWVDRAPELVIRFFPGGDPTYAPASVRRSLAAYRDFLAGHFELDGGQPLRIGVGFVVAERIAELCAANGDRVAGVEAFLEELEDDVADVDALRYLRAAFLIQEARGWRPGERPRAVDADTRADLYARAFEILEMLTRTAAEPWNAKALATLASAHFYERRFELAADTYRRYLGRWPDSDWAWLASLRLGQAQEARDDWEGAAATYRSAARRYPSPALSAVYANAYAGRAAATLGRFGEAQRHYALALAAWDDRYGSRYRLFTLHAPPAGNDASVVPDSDELTRADLTQRVAELSGTVDTVGGPALERGRRLIERGLWQQARDVLETLIAENPTSPLAPEARYLAHRARFERALTIIEAVSPAGDIQPVYEELEALAGEPWDPAVGAAAVAVGALLGTAGRMERARTTTRDALQQWLTHQAEFYARVGSSAPVEPALAADVAAIRDVVFQPQGGATYDQRGAMWSARDWPAEPMPFLIVNPDLSVKLAGGETIRVRVTDPIPDLGNVLFMNAEHLGFLEGILSRIGGTETRSPRFIMEPANQPVGGSVEILALWRELFPTRPGHWFGWVLESFPIITQVEFADEDRSEATAAVTIGYSGCTVHLERTAGGWRVVRLSNFWIT